MFVKNIYLSFGLMLGLLMGISSGAEAQHVNGWYKDATLYQVYPRSFMDTDGNGSGDLRGIIEKLDYLAELGVDALWLSPIFPSPNHDWGYDVAHYTQIHPDFGTMDDFDELMTQAKSRGIKILLDGVFNHTSSEHPWFQSALNEKNSPYRDYYIWRKETNNWKSRFGFHSPFKPWKYGEDCSAWTKPEGCDEYYLHSFTKEQPDLNWRNPKVAQEIEKVMRFWFDKGVAGMRLDVFNYILKDPDFKNNPFLMTLRGLGSGFVTPYEMYEHKYDKDIGAELLKVLHSWRVLADEYGAVLIGELDSTEPGKEAKLSVEYLGSEKQPGLHLVFNFAHIADYFPYSAQAMGKVFKEWFHGLNNRQAVVAFSNHDKERYMHRLGGSEAKMRLISTMQFTLGTPVMYQGEEAGMRNGAVSQAEVLDPLGNKPLPASRWGRDGCRTPVQWNNMETNAGFSTAAKTWLPTPANDVVGERNIKTQQNFENSIWKHYQALIKMRNKHGALRHGDTKWLDSSHKDMLVYERSDSVASYRVMLNFGDSPIKGIDLGASPEAELIFDSQSSARESVCLGNTINILPHQALIFKMTQ